MVATIKNICIESWQNFALSLLLSRFHEYKHINKQSKTNKQQKKNKKKNNKKQTNKKKKKKKMAICKQSRIKLFHIWDMLFNFLYQLYLKQSMCQ